MRGDHVIKFGALLNEVAAGRINIVAFQRAFEPGKPMWGAELLTSMVRDRPIDIGPLRYYIPDASLPPLVGRYGTSASKAFQVLDGQQRITRIVAAVGLRPPWYPEERWMQIGGPDLELSLVLETPRRLYFRPFRERRLPQIRLSDLLEAYRGQKVQHLLDTLDTAPGARQYVEPVTRVMSRLMNAEISLSWVEGDLQDAYYAFCMYNGRAYTRPMSDAQLQLSLLAMLDDCMRDRLDRLEASLRRDGLETVFTHTSVNDLVQSLLPVGQRGRRAVNAAPDVIAAAVEKAVQGLTKLALTLRWNGVTGPDFYTMPAAFRVLAHLYTRFPEAVTDEFTVRWLVWTIATERYRTDPRAMTADINALAGANSAIACRALAEGLRGERPPTWTLDHLRVGAGHYKDSALLYAMSGCDYALGTMHDLAEHTVRFPDPAMHLVRLWDSAEPGLGNRILATDHTEQILRRHHGWNRDAYEEMECGPRDLQAQGIAVPAHPTAQTNADVLVKERAARVVERINAFLAHVPSPWDEQA